MQTGKAVLANIQAVFLICLWEEETVHAFPLSAALFMPDLNFQF